MLAIAADDDTGTMRRGPNRARGLLVGGVIAAAAATMTVASVTLMRMNVGRRVPFQPWQGWGGTLGTLVLVSGLGAALASIVVTISSPTNPTGRLLGVATLVFATRVAGTYLPRGVGPWAEALLPTLEVALLATVVLQWPTGRLERAWARPVTRCVAAYVLVGVAARFAGSPLRMWTDQSLALPGVGNLVDGMLMATFASVALRGVAPALFLATVVRRHRMMPRSMRAARRTTLVAAALLAASECWGVVADLATAPAARIVLRSQWFTRSADVIAITRVGAIAGLMVVADRLRARAAEATQPGRIDLTKQEVQDVELQLRTVLDDPSAMLRLADAWNRPNDAVGRSSIILTDADGRYIASIDHDAQRPPSAVARATAVAVVESEITRRTRAQTAAQQALALHERQRLLLDAQDRSRRRLERNLHDGAQQPMVALSIRASMLARRATLTDTERDELAASIRSTATTVRRLVSTGRPAALEGGLAEALATLHSTLPVRSSLRIEGDLPGDCAEAHALWYAASEATANCLKHAAPTEVRMELNVDTARAVLDIIDDGANHLTVPPPSILRRFEQLDATVDLTRDRSGCTRLRLTIHIEPTERACAAS
jgi:signal transduction histidine kinase